MLHLKRIRELENLRNQPFAPPPDLMSKVEEFGEQDEPWRVIQALPEGQEEPNWLVVFPGDEISTLYLEGREVQGKWDEERQVFFPEEGDPLDLQGHSVSLDSLESAEEDEDEAWWAEALEAQKRLKGRSWEETGGL